MEDAAHPHFPHRARGHKLQEGRYSSAPAHSGQGCMHTGSHRSISQHPKRKRGVGGAPQRKACQAHAFTCNLTARLSPAPAEGPLSKQALLQRGTGATFHTTGRRGSTVLCSQRHAGTAWIQVRGPQLPRTHGCTSTNKCHFLHTAALQREQYCQLLKKSIKRVRITGC